MEIISLETIRPADYNPRKLSENAFEELKRSISELGVIKPIIVRDENHTIVAGHQRTRAMKALGITECPAFILKEINLTDEIRFNQIHNICEYEVSEKAPTLKVKCPLKLGFNRVKPQDVQVIDRGRLGALNGIIAKMLLKYGEYGCPCCDEQGNVIISSAYGYASIKLNKEMWVYCLENSKCGTALRYFAKEYGTFSYEHLERKTYMQTFAQLNRLRDGTRGKGNSNKSCLYETCVIPYLLGNKTLRILDFGAGKYDYAQKLLKQGYDITFVDPYHRFTGRNAVDINGNTASFRKIINDVKTKGLYDVVICDSVLNSVDTKEAEKSVIYTVGGLCKQGGKIFISGRPYDKLWQLSKSSLIKDAILKFYDADGFTSLYRNGGWFYQKFHTPEEQKAIGEVYSSNAKISDNGMSFQVSCTKDKVLDRKKIIKGLQFEFNLMLPNGKSYGLDKEITDAYEKCPSY